MERVGSRVAVPAGVIAGMLALAAGAGALAVAEGPGQSITYAGRSHLAAALTLLAGLGLAAAGVAMSGVRQARPIGNLALAAGVAWFAPVWIAWADGPPLVRSVAMVVTGFTLPLVLHMVLVFPHGRAGAASTRALIAAVYFEALAVAVALALFRDPYFDPSCWANCTTNSFLVRSLPSLARGIEFADRWFVVGAGLTLITICAARLHSSSGPARRRLSPVAVPGIVVAGSIAARAVALQWIRVEDPFNGVLFTIFVIQAISLMFLAGGLLWSLARERAARDAVAQIVTHLDDARAAGSLQFALARALHDPQLRIAYCLSDPDRFVDANGRPVSAAAAERGRAVTRLIRDGRAVALIAHGGAVAELEDQLGPAIRLGLENERLRAEALAQLEELRASRVRIVETADLERRRLERDLHDGTQQHLLALSYEIRLAQASATASGDTLTGRTLARAIEDTAGALDALRELASGIYPAVLTDAGLGPAVQTLADTAPIAVEIEVDGRRYPSAVETAAYFAVAEAFDDATNRHASTIAVRVVQSDGRLLVTIEDDGSDRTSPMTSLADRVGALGGTLATEASVCRLEIPCE